MRDEYLPKAAERAARSVENRGSVARSSPVVGREDEPGGRVGVRAPGRLVSTVSEREPVLCIYCKTCETFMGTPLPHFQGNHDFWTLACQMC